MIKYAHADSLGMVWTADHGEVATLASFDVDEFVDGQAVDAEYNWRIIGTAQNVQLIVRLYQDLPASQIYLTTPRVVLNRKDLVDPRYSIFCAQQSLLPRSLGGWHKMTKKHADIYNLATYARNEESETLFSNVISQYKFCKLLNFIPDLYLPALAKLTACILDPRWFIAPSNPDRCSALKRYLGISPAVIKKMIAGKSDPLHYRCKLVHAAWYTAVNPDIISEPNYFLHRILYAKGAQLNGWLAAANRFVDFFYRVWLSELNEIEYGDKKHSVFLPEMFFKPKELDAFTKHAASVM